MRSVLFIVSGPSGVGKGTILEAILRDGNNIRFSISATTRSPRINEIEGIHYFFVPQDKFEKMVESSEFLEWAKVHNEYYGTIKRVVSEDLANGYDVILDIDVQGALQIKGKKQEAVYIFIAPPDAKVLEDRLRGRKTDSDEQIKKRLEDAEWELSYIDKYDYIIINDDLNTAIEQLKAVIKAEKCRTKRLNYKFI